MLLGLFVRQHPEWQIGVQLRTRTRTGKVSTPRGHTDLLLSDLTVGLAVVVTHSHPLHRPPSSRRIVMDAQNVTRRQLGRLLYHDVRANPYSENGPSGLKVFNMLSEFGTHVSVLRCAVLPSGGQGQGMSLGLQTNLCEQADRGT